MDLNKRFLVMRSLEHVRFASPNYISWNSYCSLHGGYIVPAQRAGTFRNRYVVYNVCTHPGDLYITFLLHVNGMRKMKPI